MTAGTCPCACHVGGAFRPACDIAGGCGSMHTQHSATCILVHRNNPERERRAAPNLLICRGDFADLERCLVGEDRWRDGARTRSPGLAELHHDLELVLAGGGQGGAMYVSGSRDLPLPIQPVVADHRRDITDILASWVTQHMADWPETGPGTIDPAKTTRWLSLRLEKAATKEWVGDYATELRALRGRAFALLDPVRTSRFPVAWCVTPGCGSTLVADIVRNDALLPPVIYCLNEECGAEWPPHRWVELGRAVRRAKEQQTEKNGAA